MKFFQRLCEAVTSALGLSKLSEWGQHDQHSIFGDDAVPSMDMNIPSVQEARSSPKMEYHAAPAQDAGLINKMTTLFPAGMDVDLVHTLPPSAFPGDEPGPIFKPPNASPGFLCDYSAMKGWKHAGGVGARGLWLNHPNDAKYPFGGVYDIFTDYDDFSPIGITRKASTYTLYVNEQPINADGYQRRNGGKAFNSTYPGPLIEACWGDQLEITIINQLDYNGTAIHWHGVRLLNSFQYDGVNAISQCPIAPNDHFTYKFKATQYGTSWYHSHYSAQYPDGLAGPLTFHGPAAADYDEAMEPFMFSDWSHNSAFEDFSSEIRGKPPFLQTNILNGAGYYNCTLAKVPPGDYCGEAPPIFTKVFSRGRKYLLRLINASTSTTFIFSIDKHILQVIEADFVPIQPYYADSVLIGIGQRYHVIVEANPSNSLLPVEDQNYWIRTVGAEHCADIEQPNPLIGIIRYNAGSTKRPTTTAYQFSKVCADEPLESLVPVVPWNVVTKDKPANNIEYGTGDNWAVGLTLPNPPGEPPIPHGNFARWNILNSTMWLNFSDPTINHLHDYAFNPEEYCLVTEDYKQDDWVYMIISMSGKTVDRAKKSKTFIQAAHPMHLHGHDFVILAQQNRSYTPDDLTNGVFNYNNPPRRDVALLPSSGYVAIGFRTDNPGLWIMHCHIAWHASAGLALQIREREPEAKLTKEFIREKDRVCNNWNKWYNNRTNWYNPEEFQEDSGV